MGNKYYKPVHPYTPRTKARGEHIKDDLSSIQQGFGLVKEDIAIAEGKADSALDILNHTDSEEGVYKTTRQLGEDVLGRQLFADEACKVIRTGDNYKVSEGEGYVAGLSFSFDGFAFIPERLPSDIWFDVSQQRGSMLGLEPVVDVVVASSSEPQYDYTDEDGILHYLEKIGTVFSDGAVKDQRTLNVAALSGVTHATRKQAEQDTNHNRQFIKVGDYRGAEYRRAVDQSEYNKFEEHLKFKDLNGNLWIQSNITPGNFIKYGKAVFGRISQLKSGINVNNEAIELGAGSVILLAGADNPEDGFLREYIISDEPEVEKDDSTLVIKLNKGGLVARLLDARLKANKNIKHMTGHNQWEKHPDHEDIWTTAAPLFLPLSCLAVSGTVLNAFNRKGSIAQMTRQGDFVVNYDLTLTLKWRTPPGNLDFYFAEITPAFGAVSEGGIINNVHSVGGLNGFDVNKKTEITNSLAELSQFNGFNIHVGANGSVISNCQSHKVGQFDEKESSINVGHGLIAQAGCTVINHVSKVTAEDSYQIGNAIKPLEGGRISLINCKGFAAFEDFLDVKDTGNDKLVIRGFVGRGCFDSAINLHPTFGSGLVEITDSHFSRARQMLRFHAAGVPMHLFSARNIYDASRRSGDFGCMPCLDVGRNLPAGSTSIHHADVFIGGGTSGSDDSKSTIWITGENELEVQQFNCTIHTPEDSRGTIGITTVMHANPNAVVKLHNMIITRKDNTAPLIEIKGDYHFSLEYSTIFVLTPGSGNVYVRIGDTDYTESDIDGDNYGGAGNLIVGNVSLTKIITATPNYQDEPNNILCPVYQTPHVAIGGRREYAPVKDVTGMPFQYFDWLGGKPNGADGAIWQGAYSQFSSILTDIHQPMTGGPHAVSPLPV